MKKDINIKCVNPKLVVSDFIKVKKSDLTWIKDTVILALGSDYYLELELETDDKLEIAVGPKSILGETVRKLDIERVPGKLGMIRIEVHPMTRTYIKNYD